MSLRLWRKIRACAHLRGQASKKQQIHPRIHLTFRQKGLFRRNRKQYSGEIRRPISKRFLVQLSMRGNQKSAFIFEWKNLISRNNLVFPFHTVFKRLDRYKVLKYDHQNGIALCGANGTEFQHKALLGGNKIYAQVDNLASIGADMCQDAEIHLQDMKRSISDLRSIKPIASGLPAILSTPKGLANQGLAGILPMKSLLRNNYGINLALCGAISPLHKAERKGYKEIPENLKSFYLLDINNFLKWQRRPLFMSPSEIKTAVTNFFWFFKNPTVVPGVIKIRRAKTFYNRQRIALNNLNVWLGRVHHSWLLLVHRLSSNCVPNTLHSSSSWSSVQALESHWPILLIKIGWFSGRGPRRQVVQHGQLRVNGQIQKKIWASARPGDIILIQKKKVLESSLIDSTWRAYKKAGDS